VSTGVSATFRSRSADGEDVPRPSSDSAAAVRFTSKTGADLRLKPCRDKASQRKSGIRRRRRGSGGAPTCGASAAGGC